MNIPQDSLDLIIAWLSRCTFVLNNVANESLINKYALLKEKRTGTSLLCLKNAECSIPVYVRSWYWLIVDCVKCRSIHHCVDLQPLNAQLGSWHVSNCTFVQCVLSQSGFSFSSNGLWRKKMIIQYIIQLICIYYTHDCMTWCILEF